LTLFVIFGLIFISHFYLPRGNGSAIWPLRGLMEQVKKVWTAHITQALSQLAERKGLQLDPGVYLLVEFPPKPELGDLAFPMFPFAKHLRMAPPQIASEVVDTLVDLPGQAKAAGPYVNVFLDRVPQLEAFYQQISAEDFGTISQLDGRKIMVEFSCPNTNKPLHLGHLRNNSLGESVSRILRAAGAEVMKVNLINDRGVHICKSMLAYQKFGQGETPESTGIKSDRFVGDYYVKYAAWAKEDETAEEQAAEMLRAWEQGDPEVRRLWETMNQWAIDGISQTYEKTGISFDKVYFEHNTYLLGKEIIQEGLKEGNFYQREDGATIVDLPWKANNSADEAQTKVLLRSDGTSIYLTQDIGTAIERQKDFPFEEMIYVVGSEQDYHFKVLFFVLDKLGYPWAKNLLHLSYGMVNLPEGKMKSREGTVVDADDVIADLTRMAKEEILAKEREEDVDGLEETSLKIALGALHYFLLGATPSKDMIFNPKESLSFNGNTGPYLQYTGARITNLLAKAEESAILPTFDPSKLSLDEEWEIMKHLSKLEESIIVAASDKNPSVLTTYLYELTKLYSRYYHDHQILKAEGQGVAEARVALCQMVLRVLKIVFNLLNIPYLRSM
jgi:arginyl-tRNA synthetase